MATIRIPKEEFEERTKKIQREMEKEGIDLYLAFSNECEPAYVRYLADYWPNFETAAVLIPAKGNSILLPGPEAGKGGYAEYFSKLKDIIPMMDFRESSQPSYSDMELKNWGDIFKDFPAKRVAIAGEHMFPYAIFQNIKKAAPEGTELFFNDDIMRRVMVIKSENERNCMREAARIAEVGLKAALDNIKVGMLETELLGIATAAMLAEGAESTAYTLWCVGGEKTSHAIGRPEPIPLKEGPAHIQLGARVSGYCSSLARPVYLGKMPSEIRDFYQCGVDASNLCVSLLREGNIAKDVAIKTHDFIRSKGFGDRILYGPAHTIGQMECEWPFIESDCEIELKSGMTISICLFLGNNELGLRFEDGVIVRDGDPEQLTSYRKEVISVE